MSRCLAARVVRVGMTRMKSVVLMGKCHFLPSRVLSGVSVTCRPSYGYTVIISMKIKWPVLHSIIFSRKNGQRYKI